ncbi:choice-of-anchor L domain-containing protein [Chryseobacterium jejuense]|uniref:Gliding motility-associated C-terminal domain n=1 Tax=Chryseobacterium jejuense TaxID=445960 RepID=A0A2X2ZAC2_CHRJE|nr:choice-of-anchor L domain-containing protein [Chryseobacterium jejuense]SDI18431.1 gliding motility-associated C-terminal domain-containing protein [Chryseobacterium jejuense]SQB46619.1 gliding motility-associated C-terminal domain [Chryseobacterium jejuense]
MLHYRFKHYFFLLTFLLTSVSVSSQENPRRRATKVTSTGANLKAGKFIDVNVPPYAASGYFPEQIVKDILINGGSTCTTANITNVTVSPNHTIFDDTRFWGYFNRGTTNFPFKDGIVLTTGHAKQAGNVLVDQASEDVEPIGSDSDPDLVAATNATVDLKDAVSLEFDFVPNSTQVRFNYIFASEEYSGGYPCTGFSDAFALLLKKVGDPTYTNLAVLPGSAGPVSATNIVPAGPLYPCGPINEAYFGGINTPRVEINYYGRTIPLTAIATVIPGQTYHFKMVIADAKDRSLDSAVFLEGGSFDIGVKIIDETGANLPPTINMCDNSPKTLKAQVELVPGTTFQWYKDGVLIPGATNVAYVTTEPGVYTIKVMVPGSQCPGEAKITVIGGTSPTVQSAVLKLCTTPTVTTFDLEAAIPMITTTPGAVTRFYTTLADAQAQNNNYIKNLTTYDGTDGQVLHVLVTNGGFCSRMATLTLNKEATPTAGLNVAKLKICLGESVLMTATGGVTYEWKDTASVTDGTRTVSPTKTTTYSVYAIGAQGCKSAKPAEVTVEVVPAIVSTLKGGHICEGDRLILDAGPGTGYTYEWNTGEKTQSISVNKPGEYTVTINNGVCSKEFKTQVIKAIVPQIINVNYNDRGTMILTASNPSNGILEYSVDNGATWQVSNIFTNVPKNEIIAIRVRVKNTSCVGFIEYFTFVMRNVITPNGDNINDIIDFRGIIGYKDFSGKIFDRYGKEVFKAEKVRPYWDGYFQGKRLLSSSYWYQVTFEDPASKLLTVKTGWILLKNIE